MSKEHFLSGKKVIVAGSGIAGMCFVSALHKQWDPAIPPPEIVVYDRDPKEIDQTREGYSLSLNGRSANDGLVAFRDLGLLDQVLEHSLTGPDSVRSFRLWDANFSSLLELSFQPYDGLPTAGIRIQRKALRKVLRDDVERLGVTMRWETACTSAERLENGRIRVTLQSPSSEDTDACDLLVAADGAHSKIRAALRPDDILSYAGAVQMGGVAKFHNGIPSPVDKSWGMVITGQGVGLFASIVDDTSVVWALSRNEAEARPKAAPDEGPELLNEASEIGSMIKGPFPELLDATDPSTVFTLASWDKEPFRHDDALRGVVFIGDSNHAVSPFAGNGANLALKDGWDLAAQLCHGRSLDDAVSAYDELAVPRAVKTLKTSHQRIGMAHCSGLWFMLFRFSFGVGRWFMWLAGRS